MTNTETMTLLGYAAKAALRLRPLIGKVIWSINRGPSPFFNLPINSQ